MEGFLLYVITPLVLLYALLASFITMDLWALLISTIGTIVVMFSLGMLYQSTKK
ncbi:MAG: hypothetical protein N2043_01520 [Ignavibacterium sp.]|nr:hypothetical protein [Ignavibacterium sp.]